MTCVEMCRTSRSARSKLRNGRRPAPEPLIELVDPFVGTGGIVTTTLPGGTSEIYHVEPLPDGRLLAVGGYESAGGDKLIFARYLRDGQPDTTFGDGSVAPGVVVESETCIDV